MCFQYDFELEEGVLQWSERQRRQQAAVEQAKLKNVAEAIENFAQSQKEETPEVLDSPKEIGNPSQPTVNNEAGASSDATVEHPKSIDDNAQVQPGPAVPFFHGLSSGGILVPTRIASESKDKLSEKKAPKAAFNIADFEREQDPFENMELKVLDDMEELNKVLQASNISTHGSSKPKQQAGGTSSADIPSTNQPAGSVPGSVHVRQPFVAMSTPVQAQPAGYSNGVTSLKHVEYPDIDSMSNINSNSNGMYSQPSVNDTGLASGAVGQVQFTKFGAQYTKAQLPPANYGVATSQPVSQARPVPNTSQGTVSSGYHSQGQKGVNDMAKAFQEFLSQQRPTDNPSPNGFVHNIPKTDDFHQARAWSPPPTMNRLRSARSVPDLAGLDDSKNSTHTMIVTNSPQALRHRTQTPPPRPSSGQVSFTLSSLSV